MSARRIGVLGSGDVGQVLADGFLALGDEVMRGSRDPAKLAAWQADAGPRATVGSFADTAAFGEIVVLAVKGHAVEALVAQLGAALDGKLVIDPTNPIVDGPPDGSVLRYFTGPNASLLERLQALAPAARWVKAFSCVGSPRMVQPDFGGVQPSMFICGDDAGAKREVTAILSAFGWQTEDMGGVTAARAIEPLAMLWCIPGFLHGEWTHAFHLLH